LLQPKLCWNVEWTICSIKIVLICYKQWILTPPILFFWYVDWMSVPSSVCHILDCTVN
jgi:hypothetical protein